MRKIYMTFLALMTAGFLFPLAAQIGQGGTPLSFSLDQKMELKAVPFEIMPAIDIEALKKEDVYNDQIKDQPWRFGENLMVSLNPKNSGVWDQLENGDKLWRLGITSKGAQTINLTFDNYRLPKGATLFIYNADKSEVIGAFTDFNNQDDHYFATTLIKGESIIIEYFEPANVDFPGELNLWRVTHGYRGIVDYQKSFGSSGTCNVNAVCSPQGDPIRDQIRSVALLILGGGLCSGALINNTGNDGTPYFLSANHCYEAPGTAVFWFNWQSATCSNPGSSPLYNSISGATDKATYATSDFWLMQLNSTPPAGYNVYYAGWNHTTDASIATKVWGIHHPSGDIKKISWCNAGVTTSSYLGSTGDGTDHWRIGSWSDGTTTEPGSSGSPLFDTDGRIIGQLHGGYASCTSLTADYYGKLGTSWAGGGTNSTRLSNWLDPASSGATTLNGYDPNAIVYSNDAQLLSILSPIASYTELGNITPRVVIKNNGSNAITAATLSYVLDAASPVTLPWTGNLATGATAQVDFLQLPLTVGDHEFIAKVVFAGDENPDNDSLIVNYSVVDCGGYSIPVVQGFNSETIEGCWNIADVTGTSGDITFVTDGYNPTCSPSEGTHMVRFNSYSASNGNQTRIISPSVSTIGFDSIYVSFDWQQDGGYSSSNDRVSLQYSLDGTTWINVQDFLRYNTTTGWQSKSVLMPSAINHLSDVYFGLLFTSGFGNNCHLDNLEIIGTTIDEPYPNFTAVPIETAPNDTVLFTDASWNGPFTYYDWNFGEGAVPATDTGIGPHKVVYTTAGLKTVSLMIDSLYTETKTDYITIEELVFPSPYSLTARVDNRDVLLEWNKDIEAAFEDDFESGNLSLWDVIQGTGTTGDEDFPYWFASDNANYNYEGTYHAQVSWGYTIDTWMISPFLIATASSSLNFIWQSSYYWHVDPNANGELTVEISTDGGSTWNPVWNFTEIGVWDNWTWMETEIDLSDYSGQVIQIAFHMVANDNADVAVENVVFGNDVKVFGGTHAISGPNSADLDAKSLKFTKGQKSLSSPLVKAPALVDYSVYRNAVDVGSTAGTSYTDESLADGTYTYYIIANYNNPEGVSEPSNTVEVVVSGVAVEPNEVLETVRLYPNPSEGLFTIETDREYTITVLNISGSVVDELKVNSSTRSIDLSDKQEGLYILKFTSDDNTFEVKVIIK